MKKIDKEIETTIEALKRRGFDARYAENREVARKMIVEMVPENWIVGCGDSATVRSIGVLQDLADWGNRVLNPFVFPKIMRENPQALPLKVQKHTSQSVDVHLCSANAVTRDGQLMSIDGAGARVTGMAFGQRLSIIVAGRNKIVKDLDEALWRLKNVIAPVHAKNIGMDAPCADTGKCVEPENFCEPARRICCIRVVLESKTVIEETQMAVIIVDEDLGLGWDPAWPQERKDKILAEYKRWTPPHRPRR